MDKQVLAKLLYKKTPLSIAQLQTLAGISRATAYRVLKEYKDPKSDLNLMIDGLKYRRLA